MPVEAQESLALLGHEVAHFGLRALIIICVIGVVTAFFRRYWSAARLHGVWMMSVFAVLVLPMVYWMFPGWRIIDAQSLRAQAEKVIFLTKTEEKTAISSPEMEKVVWGDLLFSPPKNSETRLLPQKRGLVLSFPEEEKRGSLLEKKESSNKGHLFYSWLGAVWSLGILYFLITCGVGKWRLRQLLKRARLPNESVRKIAKRVHRSLHIDKEIPLWIVEEFESPVIQGVLRPQILLPHFVESIEEEQVALIIKHELIHLKRGDVFWNGLSYVASCLYWINPLVWIARKRIAVLREYACDDWVLENEKKGVKPYAQLLVDFAQKAFMQKQGPARSGVGMAQGKDLEKRIVTLINTNVNRRRDNWMRKGLVNMAVGVVVIPLLCIKLEGKISEMASDKFSLRDFYGKGKNSVYGKFLGIDKHQLWWKHPDSPQEIALDRGAARMVEFSQKREPVGEKNIVVLANGDRLVGEVISLDENEVVVLTTSVGKVRINRQQMERIVDSQVVTDLLYQHGSSEEGGIERVNRETGFWGRLHFLEKKSASFVSQNVLPQGDFALVFDSSASHILLSIFVAARGTAVVKIPLGDQKEVKRVELTYNHLAETVTAYIDGKKTSTILLEKKIKPSKNPQISLGIKKHAIASLRIGGGGVSISNLQVYHWDGEANRRVSRLKKMEDDQILLTNGSILQGTVNTINREQIAFQTKTEGLLIFPKQKIKEICFAEEKRTTFHSLEENTRLFFTDGTDLQVKLNEINSQERQGKATYLGKELTFEKEKLRQLLFRDDETKEWVKNRDVLIFKNGDRWVGKVKAIEEEYLIWQGNAEYTEIRLSIENLKSIRLAGEKNRNNRHVRIDGSSQVFLMK